MTGTITIDELGCKPNDPTFKDNAAIVNELITRIHSGRYSYDALKVPRGDWFTYDELVYPPGFSIRTKGAGIAYPIAEENYSQEFFKGPVSRIIKLGGGNIIRCGSVYPQFDNLVLQGRRCKTYWNPEGKRADVGILVEGMDQPATSKANFNRLMFIECDTPFLAANKPKENHADDVRVRDCYASRFKTFFRSENIQAVSWLFDGCGIGSGDADATAFDIQNGGRLRARALCVDTPDITLLRLGWCSEYINGYWIDFDYDTPPTRGKLTLLECSPRIAGKDPMVRITGTANVLPGQIDLTQLYKMNGANDRDVRCDVTNLPERK